MLINEKNDIWHYLSSCDKPVYLYGMGNGADKIISVLNSHNIKITGIFASDDFVRHQKFHDFTVISYNEAKEKHGDMIILLAFGSSRDEVLENISRLSSLQELYAPDVPVYGDKLFTYEFWKQNKNRFEYIYEKFGDELSKKTFEAVINYKLSGKLGYLKEVESNIENTYINLLRLSDKERYLDIGAYNGDTVLELIGITGNAEKIWAVEPDKHSFKKLSDNTKHLPAVNCFFTAAGDHDGVISFESKGKRGSSIGIGKEIPSSRADTLLKNEKVTFVKIDAEGAELDVINGMENTVKKYAPKLRIACYHRSDDLFAIPERILSLNPGYKLFMRKYKGVPAWDTDYYFI